MKEFSFIYVQYLDHIEQRASFIQLKLHAESFSKKQNHFIKNNFVGMVNPNHTQYNHSIQHIAMQIH